MRIALNILFILFSLITLFLLNEIWEPVADSTTLYSKEIKLKKSNSISFEVNFDGCYQIELIPINQDILGDNYKIRAFLNPKPTLLEKKDDEEMINGNLNLGVFCAESGDDFELTLDELDDRLRNKTMTLLISDYDAMPSQNLVWAKELRPFFERLFFIFLGLTGLLGMILLVTKLNGRIRK